MKNMKNKRDACKDAINIKLTLCTTIFEKLDLTFT